MFVEQNVLSTFCISDPVLDSGHTIGSPTATMPALVELTVLKVCCHRPIYPSLFSSFHLLIRPLIHLFICSSPDPFFCLSIFPSSTDPFISQWLIYTTMGLQSAYPLTHIHLLVHPSVHWPNFLYISDPKPVAHQEPKDLNLGVKAGNRNLWKPPYLILFTLPGTCLRMYIWESLSEIKSTVNTGAVLV